MRRVVKLRRNGPALMGLAANAAAALALRAAAATGRWEATRPAVRETLGKDRRSHWEWQSAELMAELNTPESSKPPESQGAVKQGPQQEAT